MNLKSFTQQHRLVALWGAVLLFCLGSAAGWFWLHERMHQQAFAQKLRETQITNDAFVEHTDQVFKNVDVTLSAVRDVYERTHSVAETERFIGRLLLSKPIVGNVYVVDADGRVVIPHTFAVQGSALRGRDYFQFHQQLARDDLHIGSVELGRLTGEYLFRVTRRVANADGSFGGMVLVALKPQAFSDYYRRLNDNAEGLTSLIGLDDGKLRARTPEPGNDAWQVPLPGSMRALVEQNPTGHSRLTSSLDGIEREFVFKQVGDLPLLLASAFSDQDVDRVVNRQIRPITVAAFAAVVFSVMLAFILSIVLRQREEMKRLATVDALTGLLSRRHFMVLAERELNRTLRYGAKLSAMMIDIDNFKAINDDHGHPVGDQVLRELGRILGGVLRGVDFIGRLGGEEFAVILPQTDVLQAFEVAERLRRTVERTEIALANGSPLNVSVSIGVCSLHDTRTTIDTLLARADQALYDAKRQGRNQVCVYEIASED